MKRIPIHFMREGKYEQNCTEEKKVNGSMQKEVYDKFAPK
jgi:hypothetical protein